MSRTRLFSSLLYIIFPIILFFYFSITPIAFAHEVYVLSPTEVQTAVQSPSLSPLITIQANLGQFIFSGIIVLIIVLSILFTSFSRGLERRFNPFLKKLKPTAPLIGRVAMGLSFIVGAYFHASFGPELPLASIYGLYINIVVGALYVSGILIILGLWVRFAALIALILYSVAVYFNGVYMLTYINYLGETILLLLVGAGGFALQKSHLSLEAYRKVEKYGFLITRVLFGTALIFASAYAKLIHSNLALATVLKYNLIHYLPFEPHFLVLGAGLVEILIGLFFIFGIEIRFTAVFLLFWLTLSLIFFGEAVWPHLILIGLPISLFCYGYDEYSLEGLFFKSRDREPVL